MIFFKQFLNKFFLFFRNWEVILFCLLLTSGIDLGAYFLQLGLFLLIFNKIKLAKSGLIATLFLEVLLFLVYIFTFNPIVLKYIGLVLFNLILFNTSKIAFSKKKNIKIIVDYVFLLHLVFVVCTFLVPPINNFLSPTGSNSIRYSGLIRGYDFVPFVFGTYIICEFRYINYKIDFIFGLKLFLSLMVTLLSGRFGLIVFSMILLQILFEKFSFAKFFGLLFFLLIGGVIFYERLQFTYQTISNILNYSENNDISVFDSGIGENAGYYSASPITWYNEFIIPFENPIRFLIPQSIVTVVDSGVSYVFSNLGILLGLILYYYTTFFFKIRGKVFYPMFFLFLMIDIKFRSLLVVLPMFWLYLNLFKIELKESIDFNN